MKIFFLGDSHTMYFSHGKKIGLFSPFDVQVCLVSASTAAGLRNSDSFTRAGEKFKDFLNKNANPDDLLIFQLGEVDCGILIWLRAEKYSTSPEIEMRKSIDSYLSFLSEVRDLGFKNIAVSSATLPTINDSDHIGEVVSERRSKVSANFRDRTDITIIFNNFLKERCNDEGLIFIDASPDFLDPETKLVSEKFRNKKIGDHHMDNDMASIVWAPLVMNVAEKLSGNHKKYKFSAVAKENTYVKRLPKHSRHLNDQLKISIKKDDSIYFSSLSENFDGKCGDFILNNNKAMDGFFFIHKKHWIIESMNY